MAAVVNETTRTVLNRISRKEVVEKTLVLNDENGKKIIITSTAFQSTIKKVIVEHYNIKYEDLIPSSQAKFDKFIQLFVIKVREDRKNKSVKRDLKTMFKKFDTFYNLKIDINSDLHIRYSKRQKSSEVEPGLSRPEIPQSPLAQRIRLKRSRSYR